MNELSLLSAHQCTVPMLRFPTVRHWQKPSLERLLALSDTQLWALSDVKMMARALELAMQAASLGEIPVGAVFVHQGQIIAEGFNQPISSCDPTAHAEIVALRQACHQLHNYRLPKDTTLYVTLEPCTMCFGALVHARVSRVVFAAFEAKSGAVGSRLQLNQMDFYNHSIQVSHGLMAQQGGGILSAFFRHRRQIKKSQKS